MFEIGTWFVLQIFSFADAVEIDKTDGGMSGAVDFLEFFIRVILTAVDL